MRTILTIAAIVAGWWDLKRRLARQEVKAGLDAATDRLKGLAANPNQPVPPVDPNA